MSKTLRRTRPTATPEMRERYRAAAKARWADPVVGAKLRAALYNAGTRAKISEATKARWVDPAARERLIVGIRASQADPVVRQKMASAAKDRWADPETRKKTIASMRTAAKRRRKRDTADP